MSSRSIIKKLFFKICDAVFDYRLAVTVVLIHTALLCTFLGKQGQMYVLPFPCAFWCLFSLLYHRIFKKEKIITGAFSYVAIAMLLFEAVMLFVRGFDVTSMMTLLTNFTVIAAIFHGARQNDMKVPLMIFCAVIIIIDIFCAISLFGIFPKELNGCTVGIWSEGHSMAGISINPNQLAALNLCGTFTAVYLGFCSKKKLRRASALLLCAVYFVFIYATHSRACVICIFGFVTVLSTLVFLKKCTIKNVFLKCLSPVLCVIVCAGVLWAASYASGRIYNEVLRFNGLTNSSDFYPENYFIKFMYNDEDDNNTGETKNNEDDKTEGSEYDGKKETESVYFRKENLKKAFLMFSETPLTGLGQGNIRNEFINRYGYDPEYPSEYLHCGFAQILVANGAVVFLLFMILYSFIVIKSAKQTILSVSNKKYSLVHILFFVILGTLTVYNFAEGNILMEYKAVSAVFWLAAAGVLATYKPTGKSPDIREKSRVLFLKP